jgi:hypothetical protein
MRHLVAWIRQKSNRIRHFRRLTDSEVSSFFSGLGYPCNKVDVERDLIRTRTAEGRSRAKARGKHMGRPPSLTAAQQKEATRRRAEGATLQELADSYDRSISTMRRATRAI